MAAEGSIKVEKANETKNILNMFIFLSRELGVTRPDCGR